MSAGQPIIATERLKLRPFTSDDAEAVTALVSDRRIAADTLAIPHPYERAMAESWLAGHAGAFARGESATFAVVALDSGALVGCVGALTALQDGDELWVDAEAGVAVRLFPAGRAPRE